MNVIWRGDAPAIAQEESFPINTDDAATTYAVVINNKAVGVAGTGSGAVATAAALQAALATAGTTIAEFGEVTWTVTGATITATATNPGTPFTMSLLTTGGSGTMGPITTVTPGRGPADISTPANYSTGALPAHWDDLYFSNSANPALYNLDYLYQQGIRLSNVYFDASYTAQAGLPYINSSGSGNYVEYRPRYFKVSADTVVVGSGVGNGSNFLQIDTGNQYDSNWVVLRTGNAQSGQQAAVVFRGTGGLTAETATHAGTGNTLTVQKGTVGVATDPADTGGSVDLVQLGSQGQPASDATVLVGPLCPTGAVIADGGTLTLAGQGATQVVARGSIVNVLGSGAVGQASLFSSASLYYQSSGALGPLVLGDDCVCDFTRNPSPRTVASVVMSRGAKFLDGNETITNDPQISLSGCSLTDVAIDLGPGVTIKKVS